MARSSMRPRTSARLYHLAARLWLTAAVLSLLLPVSTRLGVWLPLHLAMAGAVSTAISGAMQNFVSALTATPGPPDAAVLAQFGLVTVGAAAIAIGYPSGHPGLVGIGGGCFLSSMLLLGGFVLRAWTRALNRRHTLPLAMYGAAICAILAGGSLGALIGSGTVTDPLAWLSLRQAHLTLNVLGWVSVTIAATLITFLPTVLRIRMPVWHGGATAACLIVGVAAIGLGLGLRSSVVAGIGGVVDAAGALGIGWLVTKALRTPRTWPIALAAKHLVLAVVWYVAGSLALAVALVRGFDAFAAFREVYLLAFVCGWILQTLLGAWQYLLPMMRPGHPDERRRQLAAIEFGGTLQVVALNAGLVLAVAASTRWLPGGWAGVGIGLALGGALLALGKAWMFPVLAKAPILSERQRGVWGA